MVRELKAEVVKQGKYPEAQKELLENVRKTNNIFGKDRKARGAWADGLGIKNLTEEKAEVVFHAGCSYSYDEIV